MQDDNVFSARQESSDQNGQYDPKGRWAAAVAAGEILETGADLIGVSWESEVAIMVGTGYIGGALFIGVGLWVLYETILKPDLISHPADSTKR